MENSLPLGCCDSDLRRAPSWNNEGSHFSTSALIRSFFSFPSLFQMPSPASFYGFSSSCPSIFREVSDEIHEMFAALARPSFSSISAQIRFSRMFDRISLPAVRNTWRMSKAL